jgi:hypothetical protein
MANGLSREEEHLGKHLDYEIRMLCETRKALRGEPISKQVIAFALMESFCIHARNLNEFFLEGTREDTLKASAFATSDYRVPENPDDRQALFEKIHKQVAHLTTDQTSVAAEKIGPKDREEMYGWVHACLEHFAKHIRPDLRPAWKITFQAAP